MANNNNFSAVAIITIQQPGPILVCDGTLCAILGLPSICFQESETIEPLDCQQSIKALNWQMSEQFDLARLCFVRACTPKSVLSLAITKN